jgi:hypothetical protein
VVVKKHHEALLVPDEERRAAVARAFRCLWQCQADRAHPCELLGDLAWRKPAHTPIFDLLAHRARDPPPSSSLAEEERLCSLLLRAPARDYDTRSPVF